MVQTAPEIPEQEAEGKIKELYGEIKETLRLPSVSVPFRVLATHSDYLQIAWRALKPNAQTVYFENAANALRRLAVEGVGDRNVPAPPGDLTDMLRLFHYANARVFLAVAALRSATSGLQPKLTELPRDEKRQVAPGLPEDAPAVSHEELNQSAQAVLSDIRSTLDVPVVDDVYPALAQNPDFLEERWGTWKADMGRPDYRRVRRDLLRTAEEAVTALPFRMDINPHALRHAGLSEQEIDEVRFILARYYEAGVASVIQLAAAVVATEGKERAAEPAFPAAIL